MHVGEVLMSNSTAYDVTRGDSQQATSTAHPVATKHEAITHTHTHTHTHNTTQHTQLTIEDTDEIGGLGAKSERHTHTRHDACMQETWHILLLCMFVAVCGRSACVCVVLTDPACDQQLLCMYCDDADSTCHGDGVEHGRGTH